MEIFERLKALNKEVPKPPQLPTMSDIERVENLLSVMFPPSYKQYQLQYSSCIVGTFEMYWMFSSKSYLDIVEETKIAWDIVGLPKSLLPFLQDNGDYYCFDLTSDCIEYRIVYWSHDSNNIEESWTDFKEWVKNCWIGEL